MNADIWWLFFFFSEALSVRTKSISLGCYGKVYSSRYRFLTEKEKRWRILASTCPMSWSWVRHQLPPRACRFRGQESYCHSSLEVTVCYFITLFVILTIGNGYWINIRKIQTIIYSNKILIVIPICLSAWPLARGSHVSRWGLRVDCTRLLRAFLLQLSPIFL